MSEKQQSHHHHVHWDDKAVLWLEKNWKLFSVLFVAIVVTGGSYVGYGYFNDAQEKKSQEELFLITSSVQRKTEKLQEELDKASESATDKKTDAKDKKAAAKDEKPKETPKLVKNPEELKKNFAQDIEKYEQLIDHASGDKTRVMAAVQLAGLARDYKDLELALKTLEKVTNVAKPNDIYFGLVNGLLASTMADLGKCKDAIAALDRILAEKAQETFYSQTLLRKGTCHMELNEWDQAEESFSKVEKDYANSNAAFTAKNLRRLVSVKKGS